jgi:hypothetical protein
MAVSKKKACSNGTGFKFIGNTPFFETRKGGIIVSV